MQLKRFVNITICFCVFILGCALADPLGSELEIFAYNYTNSAITVTDSTFEPVWDEDDYLTTTIYQNGSFVIPANYTSGGQYGFDYDYSSSPSGENIVFDTLGFRLYKISTIVNLTEYYFYLDLRDENMNYPVDIDLKFDDSPYQWHWQWTANCDTEASMDWTAIDNSTTMTIWDLFEDCGDWTDGSPDQTKFQPTNPSNLVKLSDYNNHPRFSWTESSAPDDPNITYNVLRRSGFGPFQQIASGFTSTTFIDYEVYITQKGIRHSYSINANSGDGNIQSPGFSNSIIYFGWFGKELHSQMNEIPNTFILLGNNPNPFNPYTNIQYGLPEDAEVIMKIFDISGRNVRTFNNFYKAGYLKYKWDGKDDNGNPVSSGLYIYSILAISTDTNNNFIGSGKMILLK